MNYLIVVKAYDAAAKRSDDIEAGLTADEVTVTTSPPPASAAAVAWADDDNCSCFSDMTVRLAFIRKVGAHTRHIHKLYSPPSVVTYTK